jgi:hypothetical protein
MTSRSEVRGGSRPERLRVVLAKLRAVQKDIPPDFPPVIVLAFDIVCADLEVLTVIASDRPDSEVERKLQLFEDHVAEIAASVARERERRERTMN